MTFGWAECVMALSNVVIYYGSYIFAETDLLHTQLIQPENLRNGIANRFDAYIFNELN